MKLQTTLTLIFISLFSNVIVAKTLDASDCKMAFENGDLKAAIKLSKESLEANPKNKAMLLCQGRALAANEDLTAALASFKLADALSVDAFDKAVASMLLGNTYKALKQYDQAIVSYNIATVHAKACKVLAYERASYNAIGNVHDLNQDYELALAQYQLGSQLSANDNERGESFEKIALMHHKLQQHALAVEYQLKGYMMQNKAGSLDEHVLAGINLGRYYADNKDYASAEHLLNKMIKFSVDQGGAYYEATASAVLANVKLAKGEKDSAIHLINRAKTIADQGSDSALDDEIKQVTQKLQ